MRTSTVALALVIATTTAVGCTLFNDMDGYTGGFGDTGIEGDTGAKVDSAMPDTGRDTGAVDTGAATTMDTGTTDSGDSTVTDSGTDTAMPDTAMPDTSVVDTGGDVMPGCHVVINEIQTAGVAASDEFVELFNPCEATIDLNGYKVVYRSSSGTSDVLVATIAAGKTIAAKGFFVLGNGTFATAADAPFSGIASFSGTAGAVGVRDAATTLLDSVAYGSVATGHAFIEGTAAPQPASGASISRVPNGADTNNNSVDFKTTTSTPKS